MTGATSWGAFYKKENKVKRLSGVLLLFVVLAALASPVFAQAAAENKPPEHVAVWIVIASGFSMAIAAAACGIAQSRVAAAAFAGKGREPKAAGAPPSALSLCLG